MGDAFDRNEPGFNTLHRVSGHVYTYVTEFLFLGRSPIHNRSVIVHVPDAPGGAALAIINPAELPAAVEDSLHELERSTGARVRYLISPGDWHYLFIDQHVRAFPEARALVPPGRIPAKNPAFAYTLLDVEAGNPLPELAPQVIAMTCRGLADIMDPTGTRPRHELVFYLPEIRAITSGDVFYYIGVDELSPAQVAIGQRARVLDFHFAKWKMIRDAAAFRGSLERVLAWDFDRYISIHGGPGNMLERGARAHLEEVLSWISSGKPATP
jgi:hypothetical protein